MKESLSANKMGSKRYLLLPKTQFNIEGIMISTKNLPSTLRVKNCRVKEATLLQKRLFTMCILRRLYITILENGAVAIL